MFELQFLGRGNAFFTQEGNTAAFFVEEKTLFLINCGELTFAKILETELLEKYEVEVIFCFITNLRSDCVGSLGSLINYCAYGVDNPIEFNLIWPNAIANVLNPFLLAQGCDGLFRWSFPDNLRNRYESFRMMRFIGAPHQTNLPSYCIEFITSRGRVFYAGDTNDIDLILGFAKDPSADYVYAEATMLERPNNYQLTLSDLERAIPGALREKVCLMQFDCIEAIICARKLGFRVAKCIK